ncbi:MAG: glycosyltransferase family protein [Elusimicrobiota bacterium]
MYKNKPEKIAAICQARMGSTRLPGKTMMELADGKSLLWHVLNRVKYSKYIDNIIIATSNDPQDRVIVEFAQNENYLVYIGNQYDVLDRYYQSAKKFNSEVIVRITPDDPFKDPEIIDKGIEIFFTEDADFVANYLKPTYPEGIDIEVFSFEVLKIAWQEAKKKYEREHVSPFIYHNKGRFKVIDFHNDTDYSSMRWTIDYKQDFVFAQEVYKRLYKPGKIFLMNDIINLLKREPELTKINSGIERAEGLKKSMKEEGIR